MRYRISHTTTYQYASEVTTAHNQARMAPRRTARQERQSFELAVQPEPIDRHDFRDYFGNRIDHFSITHPHRELDVTAISEVEVSDVGPDLSPLASMPPWRQAVGALRSSPEADALHARQFALDSPMVETSDALAAFAGEVMDTTASLGDAVVALNHHIATELRYEPGTTTTTTPVKQVLEQRSGVCQDFAHLIIGCLRSVGLPARYVSGYLETDAPEGEAKLVGVDASHAWASVFLPGWGWLDLDPTNDLLPGGRHITTAWGRDYADVTPLKGVVFSGGGGHSLEVHVDVSRVPVPEPEVRYR